MGTPNHYLQNITHFSNILTLRQVQKNLNCSFFFIIELKISSPCVKYYQKLHANLTMSRAVGARPPLLPILYRHIFSIIIPPLQVANNFNTTSSSIIQLIQFPYPGQNIFVMAVILAVSFELPGDIFALSYTCGSTKPFLTCKLLYRHILLTY